MPTSTLVAGSLDALRGALDEAEWADFPTNADVVILPTAAAFSGAPEAAAAVAHVLEALDARIEALMVTDRTSSAAPSFAARLATADVVVLADGSPLHARSVWHNTAVGDAINAASRLIAVGATASVLGEVMIDPRGGAPMNGLGYRPGIALCSPASVEQLARTRSLMSSDIPLVVLGPQGVLWRDEDTWRILKGEGVIVTRGHDVVDL